MSFGQNEGGTLLYVSVVAGKFASKLPNISDAYEDGDVNGKLKPNHRVRMNKNSEQVAEFTFDSADGMIDRFETRESDFGTQISISLKFEDGTIVVISTNAFNDDGDTLTSIASSIGDQIGLVDFNKELKIGLSKRDGKVRGISFEQDGVYIPSTKENEAFKEHISQRPQATKKNGLQGEKWDFSAPSEWQWGQIQAALDRFTSERTSGDQATSGSGSDSEKGIEFPNIDDESDKKDDLPF